MNNQPRLLHNPGQADLAACDPWVRGLLLRCGDCYRWNLAGASHAKLKVELGRANLVEPLAAQRTLLDTSFESGVDVQRVGDSFELALAADIDLDDMPDAWRQCVIRHLHTARMRHREFQFVAQAVMDVWRESL